MLIMPFYQFKTRSPPASLSFKGQATKQTIVKMVYYIIARSMQVIFSVFYSLILKSLSPLFFSILEAK